MPQQSPEDCFSDSLFLFDGSALAYRAHFAMSTSSLSNSQGLPTGATYGVATELKRLMDRIRPRYAALVMDTPDPTFRHERFPEYKATRERMPDELVEQLPWIKDSSRVLGIPVLEQPGYEADDIMGTLAKVAEKKGIPVFLVTGDKDFMQLVGDQVWMYNILQRKQDVVIVDKEGVREKFGVTPDRVIDVLGLMGDASDNVPGVPGIGEKTARKLIQEHGSVETLLSYEGDALSSRVKSKLQEFRDQALLSKELVTIDTNVPTGVELDDLIYSGPDAEQAAELFQSLDFGTLAKEMAAARAPKQKEEVQYEIVRTQAELNAMLAILEAADLVSVDTETTGLNPRVDRIVGFSFATAPARAWYVPLNLKPPVVADPEGSAPGEGVVARLRPLLESDALRFCGQNVKYDHLLMRNHGIRLVQPTCDTMLAAYLLEPHERERNLDALALRHFDHVKIKTEELIGKGKNQLTMGLLPVDDVGEYACEDADYTWRLGNLFLQSLDETGLRKLHDKLELPLIEVLADMEDTGVRVEVPMLKKMAHVLSDEVDDVATAVHKLAGREFNINSPKQLGEILFEELKIHEELGYKPKRTKTGWGTGQPVLEALADHPLPGLVLKYRSLTKLLSTYIIPLPEMVNPEDGRIHASFNQTVAATGRLSSSDPNLQNIPIRTPAGRRIREAFTATDKNHILMSADYSQVELRIMAHMSEDEAMVQAFREGADIHRDTASRVFEVHRDQVDATMRSRAKAINFGLLYGMGATRLARDVGMTRKEAVHFIDRYFEAFPRIRDFLESLKEAAREKGYAETLLGRRRPIPDIHSSNGMLRSAAENMAVNTPIQGSAADILKVAMATIHRRLRDQNLKGRMILTVHDEIVVDLPKEEEQQIRDLVVDSMEGAADLRIPLKVDVGTGSNWLEAH